MVRIPGAWVSPGATSWRFSPSGGLIETPAVLVRRIGDPADDVLGGLEPLRSDENHVHRILDIPNGIRDFEPLFMPVLGGRSDDQQIDVAVLCHLTCRGGAE